MATLGFLQTWVFRNVMNPDGISYLEIARTGLSGWHGFINAYWSPLYPFLLSLVLRWFKPSAYWEFAAAHFLNFTIYLVGYACFELVIKELLRSRSISTQERQRKYLLSDEELYVSGTLFYVWSACYWLGTLVSPDFLVAAIFWLATVVLLRVRRDSQGWATFVLLGLLLGLGYLAKAPMFLLGFVFAFATYRLAENTTRASARAAVALLLFLIIAAPLVTALSHSKHRFTFSDTSTISYAEYVNQVPLFVRWHGEGTESGTPAHPLRRIWADPPLFEFATPIPGSYPPWYDPSYWYDGVRAHFSLRGEFWAIVRGANEYLKMFSRSGVLWCVLVAVIWAARKGGGLDRSDRPWWPILLPGVAALAMYSLVHVEVRFVTGVGLFLIAWTLSRVQISPMLSGKRVFWPKMVIFLAPAIAIGWYATHDLSIVEPFTAWQATQALHDVGVPAGAKVGYIGIGLDAHWAHLTQVQIVAELPDPGWNRFVALDNQTRQAVLQEFASTGAIAVVTRHAEVAQSDPGWQQLANTNLFVLLLAPPEPGGAPGASENYP